MFSDLIKEENSIIQEVILPNNNRFVKVFIKRDDLIHPEISGNKWRKLKYNINAAIECKYKTILTFGGAFSNHIYAVASAGKIFGFNTIGIIRGEEHLPLNPTLSFATKCGMELHYLDRTTYRKRNDESFREELANLYNNPFVVPEGGSNLFALQGVEELVGDINIEYDYICCANGTGGTIAGIISALKGNKKVLGFPSLKGGEFLYEVIDKFVFQYTGNKYNNYLLVTDYHFGGYAKINKELVNFINLFEEINNIPLDPIYTAKMFYGINRLIKNGFFKDGETIIAVHTGGLQGLMGMKEKMQKLKAKK
ncbi:MAG TPA: pyridoxal-phosphate dependent enzyme [Melioribacteraceae bacterium]|nr:pyridoxal-phosphate dependent enzyme [Melioribacteraceae bacterium]